MNQNLKNQNIVTKVLLQGQKGSYNLLVVRIQVGGIPQFSFYFTDQKITTSDGRDRDFLLFIQDMEIVDDNIVYITRANTMLAESAGGVVQTYKAMRPAPSQEELTAVSDALQELIESFVEA